MLQAADLSKQAALKLAQERLSIRNERNENLLRRSVIPPRFANANLDHPLLEQKTAYAQARNFVSNFSDRLLTGAGMVLWGDVGTGKSYLACAIANSLRTSMRQVLYCTAIETVMLIKSSWKKADDNLSEYEIYDRFGTPDLLIIDEVGVQLGSDFERLVLTNIADIRSRNCLPTIIISNLNPEEIYCLLGERMFDRLVGFGADVIEMAGASLRTRPTNLNSSSVQKNSIT